MTRAALPSSASPRPLIIACVAAIACCVAWWVALNRAQPQVIADERFHHGVAADLVRGVWPQRGYLPMLPAYHYVAGLAGRPFGNTLAATRAFSVVLSACLVVLAARAARQRDAQTAALVTLLIALNPVVFPFTALAYTDVAALLTLVAATLAARSRRDAAAGAALVLGFLVRTSSAFWLPYFAADRWRSSRAAGERNPHGPVAAYVLATAAIAVLVWLTRDSVIGTQPANRLRFNPAQFYLFGFVVALLWAPLWIEELARMWRPVIVPSLSRAIVPAGLIGIAGALSVGFTNPHPWNGDFDYLRNHLLMGMLRYGGLATAVSSAIVLAACAAIHWTRRQANARELALVWLFALLYLAPHWLVEPRYYMFPLTLLHLTMSYTRGQAVRLLVWNGAITAVGCGLMLRYGGAGGIW